MSGSSAESFGDEAGVVLGPSLERSLWAVWQLVRQRRSAGPLKR